MNFMSPCKQNNLDLSDLKIQMETLKKLANDVKEENIKLIVQYPAEKIVQQLISDLHEYDTNFLTDYYKVLQSNDNAAVKQITYNILSRIQQALRHQRTTGNRFEAYEQVTLAAWLSAATLWSAPAVPEAARTLQTLLVVMGGAEIKRIAEMWWRVAPGDALLQLAATARAPPAPPALADMLLRAQLQRLAPAAGAPRWGAGALRADELQAAVGAAQGLSPQLLHVAARVLASDFSKPLLRCLDEKEQAGGARGRCELLLVRVSLSMLHALFGDGEIKMKDKWSRKRRVDKSGGIDDA